MTKTEVAMLFGRSVKLASKLAALPGVMHACLPWFSAYEVIKVGYQSVVLENQLKCEFYLTGYNVNSYFQIP